MSQESFDKELEEHAEKVRRRLRENPECDAPVRDAATLILLRVDDGVPRVLMGKRSSAHTFMPDVYVFPGGRVDDGDEQPPSLSELAQDCHNALVRRAARPPRAFAMTAIRETFEETGLVVGRCARLAYDPPENWRAYFNLGAAPCLKDISFLGRAVTPPGNTRRFDTRFMIGRTDQVLMDDRPPQDSDELSELRWLTLGEAQEAKLPIVTRFVLRQLTSQLQDAPGSNARFHWRWGEDRFDVDDI